MYARVKVVLKKYIYVFTVIYNLYIIVRLQNTGVYRIYNPKALGSGSQAKQGYY